MQDVISYRFMGVKEVRIHPPASLFKIRFHRIFYNIPSNPTKGFTSFHSPFHAPPPRSWAKPLYSPKSGRTFQSITSGLWAEAEAQAVGTGKAAMLLMGCPSEVSPHSARIAKLETSLKPQPKTFVRYLALWCNSNPPFRPKIWHQRQSPFPEASPP